MADVRDGFDSDHLRRAVRGEMVIIFGAILILIDILSMALDLGWIKPAPKKNSKDDSDDENKPKKTKPMNCYGARF